MASDIISLISYFMHLTLRTELLWVVAPLAIATIVMLVYFEKYRDERPGWNTHVANSLVLLFIGIMLLRHIHSIDGLGSINYITFPEKLFVSAAVLGIGILVLGLNFEHFLAEKIARYASSPLTTNLVAYIATVFVFSKIEINTIAIISLIIYFILLILVLNIIRIPTKIFFKYLAELKAKEKREEITADKKEIKKRKKEISQEEKRVKAQKKEIKEKEIQVKKQGIKKLDKQKKEAIKLKKIINK